MQERFNPINKKDKEFRIFDPANNSLPLFSQDEILKISPFVSLINKGEEIDENNLNILFKIIAPIVDQS